MLQIKVFKVDGELNKSGSVKLVQEFLTDGYAEQWCRGGKELQIGSSGEWYVTKLNKSDATKIRDRVSTRKDTFIKLLDIQDKGKKCVFTYKWVQ
jgi:hypothetical protein